VIVALSGGIAVGKTVTAELLAARYGGTHLRVRQALADAAHVDITDRLGLQREGASLDVRTDGAWLSDYIEEHHPDDGLLLVDSIRTRRQGRPLLDRLADAHLVYLQAHAATRRVRYNLGAEQDSLKASVPFDDATAHETELRADEVRDLAELTLDTDDLDVSGVAREIGDALNLPGAERT